MDKDDVVRYERMDNDGAVRSVRMDKYGYVWYSSIGKDGIF